MQVDLSIMFRFMGVSLVVLLLSIAEVTAAEPLIEVQTLDNTVQGRKLLHDHLHCKLLTRSGTIETIQIDQVTGFRIMSPRFRPYSAIELRAKLRHEFRDYGFEVKGTSRYLVVANEGYAAEYAELFDQIYREFRQHFSVRGFNIPQPEFPMVAILFPERDQFAEYAAQDGITNIHGLAGYYDRNTNRVALFDPDTTLTAANLQQSKRDHNSIIARAGISTDLQDTIVHEATHQIAFNVGLHTRAGDMPKWIVEGLATVFEHPDMRGPARGQSSRHRVNNERYVWFGNYLKTRYSSGAIADLVASDLNFTTNTLDAYSQAWAFSFFLMERYGSQYSQYLATVSSRKLGAAYPASQRLQDFETCFGRSAQQMEIDLIRFFNNL